MDETEHLAFNDNDTFILHFLRLISDLTVSLHPLLKILAGPVIPGRPAVEFFTLFFILGIISFLPPSQNANLTAQLSAMGIELRPVDSYGRKGTGSCHSESE